MRLGNAAMAALMALDGDGPTDSDRNSIHAEVSTTRIKPGRFGPGTPPGSLRAQDQQAPQAPVPAPASCPRPWGRRQKPAPAASAAPSGWLSESISGIS